MKNTDDGAWFAPRRYGIGAGLPLAWQGWATIGLNGALITVGIPLLKLHRLGSHPMGREHLVFVGYTLVLMLLFAPVYAAKTRGGWRWRWGWGGI